MMTNRKEAFTQSTDPVQNQLRKHKDDWNMQVKQFITKLIALKQGLNGKPVAPLNIPKNSIKDPLPEGVTHTLNDLAAEYSKITQEALDIAREQAEYSENRKKPQAPRDPNAIPGDGNIG